MTIRHIILAFALTVLAVPLLQGNVTKMEFFAVEDLRPGMKGIGKTCFKGAEPEEFQVEIIGVLRNISPGADAVLARFSGYPIDNVGIFEGMSGSPVYIDGKLLGAIAFSYSFAKEAIGGITPIRQMVEQFEEKGGTLSGGSIRYQKSRLWNYRLPLPAVADGSIKPPSIFNSIGRQQMQNVFDGSALVPIATPLSLAGFHEDTLRKFSPQFRAMGMSLTQGTGGAARVSAGTQKSGEYPFVPGSNIAVSLISGDLDLSAGGTVTHIDGDRLYAFGHNLLDLGHTELPMYTAKSLAIFPRLESSFKIMELGELVGTIRQDRDMGIYGVVGERPRMLPLRINMTTSLGQRRVFNYELARDSILTPYLVNLTIYNTIISSERTQGAVTLNVRGTINVRNEPPVEVRNRFSDIDAPSLASLSIAAPVNYLMTPGYEDLDLESIVLDITSQEKDRVAMLDSIRLDKSEVRAGEMVEVEITYRKANGEALKESFPVRIPETAAPGALTMLIADGSTIMSHDERESGAQTLIPRDLSQLIRLINNLRKNDHLYLRFFRREPGVVVKGEGMPGLPPSILSLLQSDRKADALNVITTSVIMEYELPQTEYLVVGDRSILLRVKP
ncbi:MAG TPA: hypothetical protein VLL97_02310 [Acidobacteriota bacterium]|nr:hypothetical protein [Acidobacteriota bacterium]